MRNRRPSFPRYRGLSPSDLHCDLHVHTSRTDGEAQVEAVLREARERRLRRIAFTEHVRRTTDWFADFAREVRTQARAFPDIEVLVGCETKALDGLGSLDVSEAILAECDIVLGSVHRFPDGNGGYLSTAALAREELAQKEFDFAMGILRSEHADVLAHPGGMYARRHGSDLPADLMRTLVRESLARGVAVEINSSYLRDVDGMLALFDELNPFVSIASDMHRLADLGQCRDLLTQKRRSLG